MTDPIWAAVAEVLAENGPIEQGRSRYADKPAVRLHGREIAHTEAPGTVDLRITAAGWRAAGAAYADDPAVERDRARRDWIVLRVATPADVERLRPLLEAAVEANR